MCPRGSFSSATAQSSALTCALCPKGKYQPAEGGAGDLACLACPQFSYTLAEGAARRTLCTCPQHFVSTITEAGGGCMGCLENEYPKSDGSTCLPCPAHTTGPANSMGIHMCGADPGYFATYTKRMRVEMTVPADEYDPATFEAYMRAAVGGGREVQVHVEGRLVG
jgi:hypothetical protein